MGDDDGFQVMNDRKLTSRRGVLVGLAGMTTVISGCSAVDDLAKVADDASGGADDAAQAGAKVADEGGGTETQTKTQFKRKNISDIMGEENDDSNFAKAFKSFEHTEFVESASYIYWNLDLTELDEPIIMAYTVTVRSGSPVDVLMLRESEFEYYEQGERGRYLDKYSRLRITAADFSGQIDAGKFVFVIDNTARVGDDGDSGSKVSVDVDFE